MRADGLIIYLYYQPIFLYISPYLLVLCFQEEIATLLGGTEKVDAHHVTSCVSYCKEKYTLWRADIRKKVLRTNICERYNIIMYNYHDQHHHYLLNSHRFSLQTFVKFWLCMEFLFPSSYFLSPRAPKMTGSRVHVFLSLSSKVYLGIPLASSWYFWFLSFAFNILITRCCNVCTWWRLHCFSVSSCLHVHVCLFLELFHALEKNDSYF